MERSDGLDPDGLPDAGDGGVPDAAWPAHLFASGLVSGVGRVPYGDDDGLRFFCFDRVGDVEGEGVVSAPVAADLQSIDPDGGVPIDGAEIEQDASAALVPTAALRQFEGAAVPESVVRTDAFHDAGQRRLDGVGDEDLAVEFARLRSVFLGDRVVPEAVEVQPVAADHLRPGVFRQRVVRRDILGPLGHQRSASGFPLGLGGDAAECHEQDCQEDHARFRRPFDSGGSGIHHLTS